MSGILSHEPSAIVQQWMIDNGLGTDPAAASSWPIYSTFRPDRPDSLITIYDSAGKVTGKSMPDREVQEQYGIKVLLRDPSPVAGPTKARAIQTAFDAAYEDEVSLEGVTYLIHNFLRGERINTLGHETGNQRLLYSLNVTVNLRQL